MVIQKSHVHLLSAILFIIALGSISVSQVSAQVNTTDNVTINISISANAEITVNPTNYTVQNVVPGTDTSPVNFSIKNTGSTNITNIFANVDTFDIESSNPTDTGSAGAYAGSGFVFIRNETADMWAHAGRLEWNLTSALVSENLDLSAATTNFARGWYRNNSNTFLWKSENGSGGYCNNTGTTFTIKEDPENATSGLNRDFTAGTITSGEFVEATDSWALFNVSAGALNGYCVAVNVNCEKMYIYRYDKRYYTSENLDGCTNSRYIRESILYPGIATSFFLLTSVPDGTPFGQTLISKLTISAT